MVLRITPEAAADGTDVLRLDGRLTEAHVAELTSVVRLILAGSRRLTLNLSGLTFMDSKGARLLKQLSARRVDIRGCSAFVAKLLDLHQ